MRLIILETAAWAAAHADQTDPSRCLRSAPLAPYLFNDSRHETVYDVVARRHHRLEAEGRVQRIAGKADALVDAATLGLGDLVPRVAEGQLLIWERDTTVDDGAGEAETRGYLHESDMPPWDTWVAYVDGSGHAGCLISWVPPTFLPAVDRAIQINAYGALYWLRDSTLPFAQLFRYEDLFA